MRLPVIFLCAVLAAAAPTRLKELASVEGVRENQLMGYGLVVGLAGTGDKRQTIFSAQTLTNLLNRMGVSVPPTAIQVTNTAAVMVTATLPPLAQPGTRIDVQVAAMGDAKSLQGGLLLMTPLMAADGQTYAVAQGSVVVGGFVAGRAGTTQTLNHPTAGRIPSGAIVERAAPAPASDSVVRIQLHRADFTTAARVAEALNRRFGASETPLARAENAALVTVRPPQQYAGRPVELMAAIESLSIETDRKARIVINERTGTIAMGKEVRIAPVSILHGNLTIQIETAFQVSQPAPFSQGATTVVPQVGVGVKEEKARDITLKEGATVEDLVRSLLAIGSTPRDVIAILQSMRAAGALDAELEVI